MSYEEDDQPYARKIEPPRDPHRWSISRNICNRCGLSLLAVMEFPKLLECTPFQRTKRPTEEPDAPDSVAPTPDPA